MDQVGDDNPHFHDKLSSSGWNLRIGSQFTKDAFAGDGTLLLKAGCPIPTFELLQRLQAPDVRFGPEHSPYMPIDLSSEIKLNAPVLDLRPKDAGGVKPQQLKDEAIEAVREIFTNAYNQDLVNISLAREVVDNLLTEIRANPAAIVSLTARKDSEAYTYTHSVNVCILSMYLAIQTEFDLDIEELGVGALLHDIGKVGIPASILNKTGRLNASERKTIMHHPALGAALLARAGNTDQTIISCTLDHHEKLDGTGYPNGKKDYGINSCARITAITDIYDALTTDRPFRRAMLSVPALVLMARRAGEDYDPTFLMHFATAINELGIGAGPQGNEGNSQHAGIPQDLPMPEEDITHIIGGFDTMC